MQNNLLNVCDMVGAHLGPYVPASPLKPINNTSAGKRLQKKPVGLFFHCHLLYLWMFIARNCAKMTSAGKN